MLLSLLLLTGLRSIDLEVLERHANATDRDREDYFKVLIALSVGWSEVKDVQLSNDEIEELVALWKENYYEF